MMINYIKNWKKGWSNIGKTILIYIGIAIALIPLKVIDELIDVVTDKYPSEYVEQSGSVFMFVCLCIWVPAAFSYGPKICQVSLSLDYQSNNFNDK